MIKQTDRKGRIGMIEFDFEFYTQVPDPEDALQFEADRRLRALTEFTRTSRAH